ncbi:hypothetical protein A2U01_0070629, partial [Trifolium medium]|nr:hypothetical protein [Trifolium medium]
RAAVRFSATAIEMGLESHDARTDLRIRLNGLMSRIWW